MDFETQAYSNYTIADVHIQSPLLVNHEMIHKYLEDAIPKLDPGSPFFEIGAFAGQSLKLWIDSMWKFSIDTPLIVVDPYSPGSANNQDSHLVLNYMIDILKEKENWNFFRMYSDDFFRIADRLTIPHGNERIPFGNLGFALVDGDHTPDGEMRDLVSTIGYLGERAFLVLDDAHVSLTEFDRVFRERFPKDVIRYHKSQDPSRSDVVQAYVWKGIEPDPDLLKQDPGLVSSIEEI